MAAVALAAFALLSGPLAAQEEVGAPIVVTLPPDLTSEERQALLEALAALGRPLAAREAAPEDTSAASESQVALAMGRLDAALASWDNLPALASRWWQSLSDQPGSRGSPLVVAAMIVALLIGAALEWSLDRLMEPWRRRCAEARPGRYAARVGYASAWLGLEALGIAVFAAGALLVGWLLLPALVAPRLTLVIAVAAIAKARVVLAIARFIVAPARPALRLAPLPDADARVVWFWVFAAVTVIAAANAVRDILLSPGAPWESGALLGIIVAAFAAAVRLAAIFQLRRPFHGLILRAGMRQGGEPSGVARLCASLWHVVFAVLVVVDFVGLIYAGLLAEETRFASLAVGSFLVLSLAPFAVGGYGALIDDLLLASGDDSRRRGAAGALKAFGQGLILLAAFAFLARSWGADPFTGDDGSLLSLLAAAILQVGGAALLGWTVWQGSKLALDHYAVGETEEAPDEDAMGKPGSRIATVLPVIRAFLFVAIVTISVLMALSALGVNIGPLLAGAGVVGLAVGFGAQTLVKDVITGLFYLVEDAFRKGEYIECEGGKGVVEKISLRSVQLRHHNGPLNTIPFGSMGNITNHSRDWVRIKIKIRVPFSTDLNKLRKAVKKVGEGMLTDPELGPKFLQPLKSQGAVDTDQSGFVTSVKFMSRPGEQFILRREAFARIQKAFQESGIEFSEPRVTVDSEDDNRHQTGSAAGAAAGAVVARK